MKVREATVAALGELRRTVTVDWIQDTDNLRRVIEAAIAKKDMNALVAAYAAAIVIEGPDGKVDWNHVHDLTAAAWKRVPNVVDILKGRAWAVIGKARRRQKGGKGVRLTSRKRSAAQADNRSPWNLKAVTGDLGRFAAWMIAAILAVYGAKMVWTWIQAGIRIWKGGE
jgi:hypothetical protein